MGQGSYSITTEIPLVENICLRFVIVILFSVQANIYVFLLWATAILCSCVRHPVVENIDFWIWNGFSSVQADICVFPVLAAAIFSYDLRLDETLFNLKNTSSLVPHTWEQPLKLCVYISMTWDTVIYTKHCIGLQMAKCGVPLHKAAIKPEIKIANSQRLLNIWQIN